MKRGEKMKKLWDTKKGEKKVDAEWCFTKMGGEKDEENMGYKERRKESRWKDDLGSRWKDDLGRWEKRKMKKLRVRRKERWWSVDLGKWEKRKMKKMGYKERRKESRWWKGE